MRLLSQCAAVLLWMGLGPCAVILLSDVPTAGAQTVEAQSSPEHGGIEPPRPLPGDVMRHWPAYPEDARAAGQEGTVLVRLRVSATGLPEDIRVERSSSIVSLDVAAVAAVNLWRFEPGRKNGVAEAMTVSLPIRFSLPEAAQQPGAQ